MDYQDTYRLKKLEIAGRLAEAMLVKVTNPDLTIGQHLGILGQTIERVKQELDTHYPDPAKE